MMIETVETVLTRTMAANTQLKQGVNEMDRRRKNLRCARLKATVVKDTDQPSAKFLALINTLLQRGVATGDDGQKPFQRFLGLPTQWVFTVSNLLFKSPQST